jgi:penicillin-binding protein 2
MSVFNQSRSTIVRFIFLGAMLLLSFRLFQLQILNKDYSKLADDNAFYKKVVWPNRGLMLDRKGVAMVQNVRVYDLQITPSAIKGMDTFTFCRILNIDTAEFNKRLVDAIVRGGRTKPSIFQSLLPFDVQSKLEEKMYSFPGFDLIQRTERTYPFNAGGNVFGYTNEVDTAMINRSGGYLRQGDYAGINGLEKFYDRVLRGEKGVEIFVRDNKQRIVEKFEDGKYDTIPIAGRNLKTSVDIKLQQLAEKLMANKLGAAVAIEPKTGGILAMATGPGFDPNILSGPNKRKNIGALLTDPTMPAFNFAIKGQYPPGSTFKPLGALVALDEGLMTPSTYVGCSGGYNSCGKHVACHGGGGGLTSGLAHSCNSYFITAFRKALDNPAYSSTQVGYEKWREYMSAFGLGHRLEVDLPGELKGNIPDTGRLRKSIGSSNWNSCVLMTMGIGQDRMLATPLQMANTMCIIANKGYYYTPHFVDSIDGETKQDTLLRKYRKKHVPLNIPDSSYDAVFDGMEAVLTGGTARKWLIPGIRMCGKTGTAENYRNKKKQEEHSWFVCFAPKENPQIAIAVIVQNAGQGAQFAAPIASLMVEQFLNDSISKKRKPIVEQFANKKIIPPYIKEEKYIRDSVIAFDKFEETGDSSYIRIYLPPPPPPVIIVNKDSLAKVELLKTAKLKEQEKKDAEKKEKQKAEGTLPKKTDIDKPKNKDSLKRG